MHRESMTEMVKGAIISLISSHLILSDLIYSELSGCGDPVRRTDVAHCLVAAMANWIASQRTH